eukprot:TRINITY_DN27236_c0_g1_i1.p1 TRINITY_DN27236_c0_g1~~TRINITY_DN27236_c0_g1_i1.p1  ORF type:complete len:289 (+),score=120.09 TRINITY_DN27236_c0_g1_i1:82-867(+)
MSDEQKTPVDVPLESDDDFDEDEKLMLESHIKKNQASEPANFTMLYGLVSFMTVLTVSYLFQTVLDLNFLDPINAAVYLVSGGVACYFLADAYLQMYDTESSKALSDDYGKWIKELESRRGRKADSIKNKSTKVTAVPTSLRTANEIYAATGKSADTWKTLDKQGKQSYIDQEAAEEVAYLGGEISILRNFQYQRSMGWALLLCNLLFVSLSVAVAHIVLRNYDNRVNYICSTLVTSLGVQLVAKHNDEAAKAKAAAKKRN